MSHNKFTKLNHSKKSKEFISEFCKSQPKNHKEKLIDYFSDKKIYCEIFNGPDNISETFVLRLQNYKAHIYKSLSKYLNYIVFKDGKLKTKRFASLNNIKLVNPLWIDDKITKEIFEDDSKYIVHVNYAEISPNNISNYKKTTYEKEEDEFDEVDEFQIKFSNYVDSKMKKSSKKQTESDNNVNLLNRIINNCIILYLT